MSTVAIHRPPRRSRVRPVTRALAAARLKHPELRHSITEAGLRSVLEREGIKIRPEPLGRTLGRAIIVLGHRAILVNDRLRGLAWMVVMAHEFGHHVLHCHDLELARQLREEERCGPIHLRTEAEAETFAVLLLGEHYGPARSALSAFETAELDAMAIMREAS